MKKQKIMTFRIVLIEEGIKKGMAIEQKMAGDWSVLEEIGVIDTLKLRAQEKLSKLLDMRGNGENT